MMLGDGWDSKKFWLTVAIVVIGALFVMTGKMETQPFYDQLWKVLAIYVGGNVAQKATAKAIRVNGTEDPPKST